MLHWIDLVTYCQHFYFHSQNAANAEKSFEALLSHVIGELSKDRSVYKVNTEETSMVRR